MVDRHGASLQGKGAAPPERGNGGGGGSPGSLGDNSEGDDSEGDDSEEDGEVLGDIGCYDYRGAVASSSGRCTG